MLQGFYPKSSKINKETDRITYKMLKKVERAFATLRTITNNCGWYYTGTKHKHADILWSQLSYSLMKEMEVKIFPLMKIWNKDKNQKLSFSDIIEKLRALSYAPKI